MSRVTPAPKIALPDPEAPCPTETDPGQMCYSDQQTAEIIVMLDTELNASIRQVCWLRVYHGYPACPID